MNNTKVMEERESAIGRMCIAVFGEGFKGFNIAHLVTSDGIGVGVIRNGWPWRAS